MFLDWKNQHYDNDYTTQSNLQIQCNPFQATNGVFLRSITKNFTICVEKQKTPNRYSNLEKKKKTELEESGSQTFDYTTKLP